MAEVSKKDADKAYKAGKALVKVDWDAVPEGTEVTDAMLTPGVHHCPFDDDPRKPDQCELRKHWLRGLREALTAPTRDPASIVADIDEELGK